MQFGIKVRTVGNCRVKLPRNDRHLCKSDREMRDAVSLVRNASSSGNKLAVTTYTAIRDCNLALQRLRLPEHRIKREEYGTGQFAFSEIGRYYFNAQNDHSFERFQRSIIIYKGGCDYVCNT